VNEANRSLADALYELAEFVLHGDATQKGLSYQRVRASFVARVCECSRASQATAVHVCGGEWE
jgi:hypothetical protein